MLWNRIRNNVVNSGRGITGINAVSISQNPTFSNNQIIFAANSLSINYDAYLSPGVYVNSTEYVIDVSIDNLDVLSVNGSTGTFAVQLSSNNDRLQFGWNIVVNSSQSQLASLTSASPTAAMLLNLIEERLEDQTTNRVLTRRNVVPQIVPVFTNDSVFWSANSFDFSFLAFNGRSLVASPRSSPSPAGYTISSLTFTNNNLTDAGSESGGFVAG